MMATFKYGKKSVVNSAHANDNTVPEPIEVDEKATMYEDVVNKFHHHFLPKVIIVNESQVFNKRKQGDESVDDFLIDLQKLALTCDY